MKTLLIIIGALFAIEIIALAVEYIRHGIKEIQEPNNTPKP